MTQRSVGVAAPARTSVVDFWTSVYQAIDD